MNPSDMPKLLQINVCSNIYSTGKIVSGIGDVAIQNGWESYVFYGRSGIECSSQTFKIGDYIEQFLHLIESRLLDDAALGYGSIRATRRLIREIERIKPDIIHLHILLGYYVNARILLKYLAKINTPIVLTLHSCWEFTGHCTHFDYERCYKWKSGCYECPLIREYPQSIIRDRSRKNYLEKKSLFLGINNLQVVTVSNWLKDQASESFLKGKSIKVIHNGIDVSLFRPIGSQHELKKEFGFGTNKVLLAIASAWTPKKGLGDYFDLAKRMEGKNVLIVMVGYQAKNGDQIPSCLKTIPVTTNNEALVKLYNCADIVLNLSYEETFGLTTVEGMACGTPSIVYNRTASPELVDDTTGVVVEAGDIDGLVNAIHEMIGNGREHYSNLCRERATRMFDKNKTYQKYIDLYKSLIG